MSKMRIASQVRNDLRCWLMSVRAWAKVGVVGVESFNIVKVGIFGPERDKVNPRISAEDVFVVFQTAYSKIQVRIVRLQRLEGRGCKPAVADPAPGFNQQYSLHVRVLSNLSHVLKSSQSTHPMWGHVTW